MQIDMLSAAFHFHIHRSLGHGVRISASLSSRRAPPWNGGRYTLRPRHLYSRSCFTAMFSAQNKSSSSLPEAGQDEGTISSLPLVKKKATAGEIRRRRGNSPTLSPFEKGGGHEGDSGDLLTIPGVGHRNMQKLMMKGIGRVSELKQIYRDKFHGDASGKMVEFLRSSVGIIHKNHAESITSYIKESVDEELKEEDKPNNDNGIQKKKRLTFCVEGNISVGKSTFLQRINETLELCDVVEIVPEPVSKWQDIGPEHFNILDAFYAEPKRYAYTFQNYVFVTRVMQERESASGIKPIRLMERSIFSDRMVFVRAVHEAKWMNEMEINIYDSWFDPVVSVLPGLVPDGFIYLRASPDTCHNRLRLRKRAEEQGVTLEYLQGLHEKHEQWLIPGERKNHGMLSVSQFPHDMDKPLPPHIRNRVFYLGGEHVHSCIQKVPALVLDCEANIDFNRDIEAKQEYARQVAEFFEFVKRKQENQASDKASDAKNSSDLVLPHGGLLDTDGNLLNLRHPGLNSLGFRQPMMFPN